MSEETELGAERLEYLRLRARVVALERMARAALELALRIRPEELQTGIELARSRLSDDYEDSAFAPELTRPAERAFEAQEVERLMRGIQADLGFEGGISISEDG